MNNLLPLLAKKTSPVVSQFIGRRSLVAKKQAPHIFFAAGIVGSVTSTVLACRATLKLSETLDECTYDIQTAKDRRGIIRREDEASEGRELALAYTQSALKLGRLYGPSLAVGVVSISALTGAHINLSRRNTALMAAYATLAKAYDDYRVRVRDELGSDRELDLYHAKVGVEQNGDDEVKVADTNKWSPYARFFDEGSTQFEKNAEFNRLFITAQQNYLNNLLQARGHVFLNEVYDALGLDRSSAGSVVGWVIGPNGDNFIDFGMYEASNSQFLNGWEPRILLDFNVDGVIYDKI
jgi:hypothetical protein